MTKAKQVQFGKELRQRRLESKMTKVEAARQFGVCMNSYAAWENGISAPVAERLKLICEFFEMPEYLSTQDI